MPTPPIIVSHPLPDVVMRNSGNLDDAVRAQETAQAVEALLAQAATSITGKDDFAALVREVETHVSPWRANFPMEPLTSWIQGYRRTLLALALKRFGAAGANLVEAPVEQIAPAARRGGPNPFRL